MTKCKMVEEWQAEECYEDLLNDGYGIVKVAGMEYDTSYVLKSIDPIAYRVGLGDFIDSMAEDGEYVKGYTSCCRSDCENCNEKANA